MKKLLILPLIALFTLSSFTTKKAEKKQVTLYRVYYHCTDGSGGGSFLINDLAGAQAVANHLCS